MNSARERPEVLQMKSAYELAMERLEKNSGPTRRLTDEQKARIAEIEKIYEAKVAETRLSFDAKLRGATTMDEYEGLKAAMVEAISSIESRREKDKEQIWNAE
jgi:hypothetical protein